MEAQVYTDLLLYPQAAGFTGPLLRLWITDALEDVREYINYLPDEILPIACAGLTRDLVLIRINKLGAEGITATSQSGISETYTNGMPVDIRRRLNRLRRAK